MQLTPAIRSRDIALTPELDADIRERVDKLQTYCSSVMSCSVLVEMAERHHVSGHRIHVRIDVTVPGEKIVVSHEPNLHASAQDAKAPTLTKADELDPERRRAHIAIHEAFDIVRRRLQDYTRRQRGGVKVSARQPRGRVSRLFPIDEYGYIEAEDGHEVYFQKSCVIGDAFGRLTVDSEVSFVERPGEKGPQASTVRLLHPRRQRRSSAAAAEPSVH